MASFYPAHTRDNSVFHNVQQRRLFEMNKGTSPPRPTRGFHDRFNVSDRKRYGPNFEEIPVKRHFYEDQHHGFTMEYNHGFFDDREVPTRQSHRAYEQQLELGARVQVQDRGDSRTTQFYEKEWPRKSRPTQTSSNRKRWGNKSSQAPRSGGGGGGSNVEGLSERTHSPFRKQSKSEERSVIKYQHRSLSQPKETQRNTFKGQDSVRLEPTSKKESARNQGEMDSTHRDKVETDRNGTSVSDSQKRDRSKRTSKTIPITAVDKRQTTTEPELKQNTSLSYGDTTERADRERERRQYRECERRQYRSVRTSMTLAMTNLDKRQTETKPELEQKTSLSYGDAKERADRKRKTVNSPPGLPAQVRAHRRRWLYERRDEARPLEDSNGASSDDSTDHLSRSFSYKSRTVHSSHVDDPDGIGSELQQRASDLEGARSDRSSDSDEDVASQRSGALSPDHGDHPDGIGSELQQRASDLEGARSDRSSDSDEDVASQRSGALSPDHGDHPDGIGSELQQRASDFEGERSDRSSDSDEDVASQRSGALSPDHGDHPDGIGSELQQRASDFEGARSDRSSDSEEESDLSDLGDVAHKRVLSAFQDFNCNGHVTKSKRRKVVNPQTSSDRRESTSSKRVRFTKNKTRTFFSHTETPSMQQSESGHFSGDVKDVEPESTVPQYREPEVELTAQVFEAEEGNISPKVGESTDPESGVFEEETRVCQSAKAGGAKLSNQRDTKEADRPPNNETQSSDNTKDQSTMSTSNRNSDLLFREIESVNSQYFYGTQRNPTNLAFEETYSYLDSLAKETQMAASILCDQHLHQDTTFANSCHEVDLPSTSTARVANTQASLYYDPIESPCYFPEPPTDSTFLKPSVPTQRSVYTAANTSHLPNRATEPSEIHTQKQRPNAKVDSTEQTLPQRPCATVHSAEQTLPQRPCATNLQSEKEHKSPSGPSRCELEASAQETAEQELIRSLKLLNSNAPLEPQTHNRPQAPVPCSGPLAQTPQVFNGTEESDAQYVPQVPQFPSAEATRPTAEEQASALSKVQNLPQCPSAQAIRSTKAKQKSIRTLSKVCIPQVSNGTEESDVQYVPQFPSAEAICQSVVERYPGPALSHAPNPPQHTSAEASRPTAEEQASALSRVQNLPQYPSAQAISSTKAKQKSVTTLSKVCGEKRRGEPSQCRSVSTLDEMRAYVVCSECNTTFKKTPIAMHYLITASNQPVQCDCGCLVCTICFKKKLCCEAHGLVFRSAMVNTLAVNVIKDRRGREGEDEEEEWDTQLNRCDVFKHKVKITITSKDSPPDYSTLRSAFHQLMEACDAMSFMYFMDSPLPETTAYRYVCIPHTPGFWDHVLVGTHLPERVENMMAQDTHLPKLFNVNLDFLGFHWCCFVFSNQVIIAMWLTSTDETGRVVLPLTNSTHRSLTDSREFRSMVYYLSMWFTIRYGQRPNKRQVEIVLDCPPCESPTLVHILSMIATKCGVTSEGLRLTERRGQVDLHLDSGYADGLFRTPEAQRPDENTIDIVERFACHKTYSAMHIPPLQKK